jgi:hypothetical protein
VPGPSSAVRRSHGPLNQCLPRRAVLRQTRAAGRGGARDYANELLVPALSDWEIFGQRPRPNEVVESHFGP